MFHPANIPFDGAAMNAVVEQVQRMELPPGKSVQLRLQSLGDPRSLRPQREGDMVRGKEVGNVLANRAQTGELTLVVVTVDRGHAGRLGYAYSEKPPVKQPDGPLYEVDESEYLNCTVPTKQVADRWWEVWSCYLD